MLETIRDLQKQLKYSNLVIDNFIPWEHLEKLEMCSKWDELQNEWLIEHVEHAGNHVAARAALLKDGDESNAGFGEQHVLLQQYSSLDGGCQEVVGWRHVSLKIFMTRTVWMEGSAAVIFQCSK